MKQSPLLEVLAKKENVEMYENLNAVLYEVKDWFSKSYGESFKYQRDPKDEFVLYQSENYEFVVATEFILSRTQDDFQVPIKERLEGALKGALIEKGKRYRLSSKKVNKPMPIEYCVELIS